MKCTVILNILLIPLLLFQPASLFHIADVSTFCTDDTDASGSLALELPLFKKTEIAFQDGTVVFLLNIGKLDFDDGIFL